MDAHEVKRLLREEAQRFREEVGDLDRQAWTQAVLERIRTDPSVAAPPGRQCRPRQRPPDSPGAPIPADW